MKINLKFLLFPLIYCLVDLIIRIPQIRLFTGWQLFFYFLSIGATFALFSFVLILLHRIRDRKFFFHFLLGIFTLYLVSSILGSFVFFYFNGFYPNFYTYEYFKNEPGSAFLLMKDSIKIQDVLLFMMGFFVFFFLLKWTALKLDWKKSGKKLVISGVIYVAIMTVLVLNIKKYDQCLVVDTNFCSAILRHIVENDDERIFKGKGLGYRNEVQLTKSEETRDFNVIVVLFESLRKQNLSIYDYERETTPNLEDFKSSHAENFYQFNTPYSVSTTTMLAVPAVLTGITPYQDTALFYSQPFIWDYAKKLNYKTAFLSSHSMLWYHFDRYYANQKLDHFWYKEKSGRQFFNDLGINDLYTVEHLNKWISEDSNEQFMATIQLNATHYPYKIPPKFKKWSGSFVDEYDNSILYQDHVIKLLFERLEKNGQLDNTVIIFTSDHGESLKDHNNIGHVDSYYIETISIPLMIYLPEKVNTALNRKKLRENENALVSNIDISPTLIEILGLNDDEEVRKLRSNYIGYSLFSDIPTDRYLIQMNNNPVAGFKVGLSFINSKYHYLHRMNIMPNRQELYDVQNDPKEERNLLSEGKVQSLEGILKILSLYPNCTKYLPSIE